MALFTAVYSTVASFKPSLNGFATTIEDTRVCKLNTVYFKGLFPD